MRVKVVAVTLALSLPSFLWPPKPARAATADFAPPLPETRSAAVDFAKSGSVGSASHLYEDRAWPWSFTSLK